MALPPISDFGFRDFLPVTDEDESQGESAGSGADSCGRDEAQPPPPPPTVPMMIANPDVRAILAQLHASDTPASQPAANAGAQARAAATNASSYGNSPPASSAEPRSSNSGSVRGLVGLAASDVSSSGMSSATKEIAPGPISSASLTASAQATPRRAPVSSDVASGSDNGYVAATTPHVASSANSSPQYDRIQEILAERKKINEISNERAKDLIMFGPILPLSGIYNGVIRTAGRVEWGVSYGLGRLFGDSNGEALDKADKNQAVINKAEATLTQGPLMTAMGASYRREIAPVTTYLDQHPSLKSVVDAGADLLAISPLLGMSKGLTSFEFPTLPGPGPGPQLQAAGALAADVTISTEAAASVGGSGNAGLGGLLGPVAGAVGASNVHMEGSDGSGEVKGSATKQAGEGTAPMTVGGYLVAPYD